MAIFSETFSEPLYLSDGTYAITGEISAEQASDIFSEYLGEQIHPESLRRVHARYGFAPDYVEDHKELGACWYTGAKQGKGSKPVWVCG
ncbi:MAG: hypothetical protein CMN80_03065 [Spongiibacter sp.]|uniref:hypothetical protein n=1 Tax=Spongiibacter sp. TaxID=2024860 RepID=UPI000C0B45DB|nr:hypothetical protein [Spongiibacter sp.]MAK43120.1 hypothetical protein [Spongiibacter sp.]|tara:strand:+ start:582 stop:848 length:267 start_codon:yes stop_codon:yes gene_type:complete